MIQENYCRAAFKSLFIATEPNNQVRLSSCCINNTGPLTSVIDFHNDSYLQTQRQQFKQGIRPVGCQLCWNKEDAGLPSRRMGQGVFLPAEGDPYVPRCLN